MLMGHATWRDIYEILLILIFLLSHTNFTHCLTAALNKKKKKALPHCFQIVMTLSIVSNLSFLSAYLGRNCIATLPVPIVSGGTAIKKTGREKL